MLIALFLAIVCICEATLVAILSWRIGILQEEKAKTEYMLDCATVERDEARRMHRKLRQAIEAVDISRQTDYHHFPLC